MPVTAHLITACGLMRREVEERRKKRTLKVGELERTYGLHLPPDLSKDKPAALVREFFENHPKP